MTSQLEALDRLIEAVEAGEASGKFAKLCADAGIAGHSIDAASANVGSLDAAKALHEALLPFGYDSFETFSLSGEVVLKRTKPVDRFYGFADCDPARAWLLAILKAHRAQIGGQ